MDVQPFRKIYISRKFARRRHLVNEAEWMPRLEREGFENVYLENLTIPEQIQLFQETSHIVAPHGAGLTNIVFTHPSTRILEIRPVRNSGQFCYEKLCALGWPHYEYLVPPKKPYFELPVELLQPVLHRWFG